MTPGDVPPDTAATRAFECFIAHQDGCALVVVRGELDMATAPGFAAVVDDAMAASPDVQIDMDDVTFLDSSGLRVIALAAAGVKPDGSITIRNASRPVSRALSVSGLDNELGFVPTSTDEAAPTATARRPADRASGRGGEI
jgi:anti-sigma B factor antagonist